MLRSARVPNFAISLFRTQISGSLMTVVVSDVRTTVLPGARVSHNPRRSRFDRFVTLRANLRSSDCSVRGMGLFNLGCTIKWEVDLF